jgi:hypothetical protein
MKNPSLKNIGAILIGGAFAIATGAAAAAENAAGVKEHFALLVKTSKEALEHASADHADLCAESLKAAKQHYKEITGDAAGKPLQDAMKKITAARDACQSGDAGAAAEVLKETVTQIEKIQANIP